MSLSKVFGKFGKCPPGEFAISVQGGVAIKRKNGGYSCLQDDKLVDVDTLVVDVDGAFYYLPVSPAQLKQNDVVLVGANGIGFVKGVDGNDIDVYDINNEVVSTIKPSTHFLMPTPFVTKVVSLFTADGVAGNPLMLMLLMGDKGGDLSSMLPMLMLSGGLGGAAPAGGLNPMLLMLMMGKGKDGKATDMKKMLPFLMLSGQGGGDMQKMLPFLLMQDGGDMKKMLPFLLLSGGLGGAAPAGATAINPMLMMLMMQEGGDDMLPLLLMSGGLSDCCCKSNGKKNGKAVPATKAE